MVDSKDSGKFPWVRSSFLGVINNNILFIIGDVDDVLILLKIIHSEVDLHDQMLV